MIDSTHPRRLIPRDRAVQVEREVRLARAVEAYRTFYPSVSCWSFFADNIALGMAPNQRHGYALNTTAVNSLTPNSDTPYGVVLIDATQGPIVLEVPEGPLMGVLNDWYFQEAGDVGLPGPDAGKGGKYLIAGPNERRALPAQGYFVVRPATNHVLAAIRAVPPPGRMDDALNLLARIKTYPLGAADRSQMVNMTGRSFVVSPVMREETMDYWRAVHEIINADVLLDSFYLEYGRLAAAGIARGMPFPEDQETQALLMEATGIAIEQMAVESLSSSRGDRLVWPDRRWEWAGLVENTGFLAPNYTDVYARDRWFYQATLSTRRMFPRKAGMGSVYLLGVKDHQGDALDGGKAYRLHVPGPVPVGQFWSLTVYDARYRSQVNTDQKKASISSLHDQVAANGDGSIDLYVGAAAPEGVQRQWIKTSPGEDWFAYFRLYGPGEAAFNGQWVLGDFEPMK